MTLAETVWTYCTRRRLLAPGDSVVAAVSGGSDSVALLHVLDELRKRYALTVTCAHYNHELRGSASDADEAFVHELADHLGIPFQSGKDDVRAYAATHHLSPEEAARDLRLHFLRMVALQTGASCIATAHTQDDQVETVLFRLFKGTGMRGLAGIAPRNGMFVRPLLGCSKEELQAWLQQHGWQWREDASNRDPRYERNFVRISVLPLLESRFPSVRTAVARAAGTARQTCELFDDQTEKVTSDIDILEAGDGRHPGALRLPLATLAALPDPLLVHALEDIFTTVGTGPSYERLTRSVQAIRGGRPGVRVTLDERMMLEIGYQHVYLYGAAFTDRVMEPRNVAAFPVTVDWFRRRLTFEEKTRADLPPDLRQLGGKEAWFDLDQIALPVIVRMPQPGDRVRTFGGTTQKVQDLFVNAKVDRVLRLRRPVLCDAQGILWIPVLARSGRAVITDASQHLLRIVYYSSQC